MEFLAEDPRLAEPGALQILTSRLTFSAATNFVTELQIAAPAETILGEPTGGSPNLFGDVTQIQLPNSRLIVFISVVYWEFAGPEDDRPWVAPDVAVEMTAEAWFSGADPILDAALGR